MERKLLDMTSQLFISEYNLIVEYGDNFQFVEHVEMMYFYFKTYNIEERYKNKYIILKKST